MFSHKKIVAIGGGHGTRPIIKGLKDDRNVTVQVIVPSTDSSGATGRFRDWAGLSGCTGDAIKALAAFLDDAQEHQMLKRFTDGPFSGFTVGHMLLGAMQLLSPLQQALADFHAYLGIANHRVMPVSETSALVRVITANGKTLLGDQQIEQLFSHMLWDAKDHAVKEVSLVPAITASDDALAALSGADEIIFCPTSLITSTLPILLTGGVGEAIRVSSASTTYVTNFMTERGMTHGYRAADFIGRIEHTMGRPIDRIICNSGQIPEQALKAYQAEEKELVTLPDSLDERCIFESLWMLDEHRRIVHDPKKIGSLLLKLFSQKEHSVAV